MNFMLKPQSISNEKYLSLETYRKNATPVSTPVWFVIHKDMIHVVTRKDTGKVKRLRNNPDVKIALCTFNGKVKDRWHSGKITFSSSEDTSIALELRRKKYGTMERIARFVSRKKGDFVVFSIKLNDE